MAASEHRSTIRVLEILSLLARSRNGYSLSEISRELNAPKSSLFPIIHTMEDRNFIQYNPETLRYTIGIQSYLTGSAYVSGCSVYDLLQQEMNTIVKESGETCHLGILVDDCVLYLAKKEAVSPIMLKSHVAQRLPAYCTGIGKALLSGCSDEELDRLYPPRLQAFTSNTITSLEDLKKEICQVRATGFAYENAELTEGICCIAVPLHYHSKVITALSICYPQFRNSESLLKHLKHLLSRVQKEIEHYFEEFHITDSSCLF